VGDRRRVRCFACNAEVPLAAGERVGFRDACGRCRADLHVCRNCAHHDPGAHNECREPHAEWVSDRERANRCDWFRAGAGGGGAVAASAAKARSALDDLFKKKG
jgi:hypothetical protein